jgi:hypothetical protein
MSEIYASGGRAANGGARAERGPVPVPGSSAQQPSRPGVIPPTEIMRRRREKAAAEASAEELKRYPDPPSGSSRPSASGANPSSQQQSSGQQQQSSAHRRQSSGAGRAPGDTQQIPPYSRPAQQNPSAGPGGGPPESPMTSQQQTSFDTGASQSRPPRATQASGQPRPVATAGPSTQRPAHPQRQHSGSSGRPQQRTDPVLPGNAQGYAGATSGARTGGHSASASQGTTASSFPHAFERWETLSSHWEGLTSYWIHRLEQNNEELKNEPMLAQLSRQVTDLSAAGANLFHAVVELQRLRASSERKFQRWFFETRKESERQQEITAQMEAALVSERQARANDAQRWETQVEQARRIEVNAQKQVGEMRRELQISKDEARRAWEELGRREQQERERTMALNQGQAIDVGGFIVYPKQFQGSGQAGASQRPGTREGPLQEGPQDEYAYEPTTSPSNTDPFTESRPPRQEPASYPYASGSAYTTSGSTTGTVIPATTSAAQPATSSYRQAATAQASSGATAQNVRYPAYPGTSSGAPTSSGFYNQANTHLESGPTPPINMDDGSYVPSQSEEWLSEQDEEYEMDERGQIVHDAQGNPIPYRRGLHRIRSGEESDEFDHAEDARREQELVQQYGSSTAVSYPAVPAPSSSRVQQTYSTATSGPSMRPPQSSAPAAAAVPTSRPAADYSGSGYSPPWEVTHHHPSRLSDVLEMDEEERQSRVSEMSQGAQFGGNTGAPF